MCVWCGVGVVCVNLHFHELVAKVLCSMFGNELENWMGEQLG